MIADFWYAREIDKPNLSMFGMMLLSLIYTSIAATRRTLALLAMERSSPTSTVCHLSILHYRPANASTGDGLDDQFLMDPNGQIIAYINSGPNPKATCCWLWLVKNNGWPIALGVGAKGEDYRWADVNVRFSSQAEPHCFFSINAPKSHIPNFGYLEFG